VRAVRKRYGHQAEAALRELDRYAGTLVADQPRVRFNAWKLDQATTAETSFAELANHSRPKP
jgi:hypothetical protein